MRLRQRKKQPLVSNGALALRLRGSSFFSYPLSDSSYGRSTISMTLRRQLAAVRALPYLELIAQTMRWLTNCLEIASRIDRPLWARKALLLVEEHPGSARGNC